MVINHWTELWDDPPFVRPKPAFQAKAKMQAERGGFFQTSAHDASMGRLYIYLDLPKKTAIHVG